MKRGRPGHPRPGPYSPAPGEGRAEHASRTGCGDARPAGDLVLVGEFGRPHGLKGEVRLKSFTGDPRAIATYGPLVAGPGPPVTLASVRPAPGGAPDLLVATVAGVSDRTAAEALNGVQLHLPRDKLPPPVDEDEFLLADLVGLRVESTAGEPVGTVVAVPNYGGGDLLEIAPERGGATALLPFTKAFVPLVDLSARRIVVEVADDLFAPALAGPTEDPA